MANIDIERALQHRQNGGYTVEEVEAGIVDPSEVTYIYQVEMLVYEDDLPEMTDAEYSEWYAKSEVVFGVRMGPPFKRAADPVITNTNSEEFEDGNGY